MLTIRETEKSPGSSARLQLYSEIAAGTAITLLLFGAAGPQVLKMMELKGQKPPVGLEFWSDLSGGIGILGAVVTLLIVALRPMRNWWLGRLDRGTALHSDPSAPLRSRAAAGIVLVTMSGFVLMLAGPVIETVVARSGHDIGLSAGELSWTGLLFPAGLVAYGFAAAAALILLSRSKASHQGTDVDTTS